MEWEQSEDNTKAALRFNALATGCLAGGASVFLFTGVLPFPRTVAWFTMAASAAYLLYFLCFDWICRGHYRAAGIILSQLGSAVVSLSIYYSGGVVSPLAFLYLAMLVSEAIYGLENPFTVPVSAAGYLFVVGSQYWGFLPNPAPWSAPVYNSPAFVLVVSGLLVAYLFLTKSMSGRIINSLRSRIVAEAAEKEGLLKKFSELDASSQIGTLAHRIAHDLRAPLSSISAYVQTELLKARDAHGRKAAQDLEGTVNAMSEALVSITRFGKTGGSPAERIRLTEFFRQLTGIAAFSPQARGVRFLKRYPEEFDVEVMASRPDLQQAYFNIVKNALEATQDNAEGRTIEISMCREGKEAEVVIADNGPGMDPKMLKNLFRKTVTTKKGGTGVGLLITRDLLTRNDGYMEFRNRPEGGFAVITRLPAA
jgi:signal transduction histidine kinase